MFSSPLISLTFSAALSDSKTSGASALSPPPSPPCVCDGASAAASLASGSVAATDIRAPCQGGDAGQYSRQPHPGHRKNLYATVQIGIRVPAQSGLDEGRQLLVLTEKKT